MITPKHIAQSLTDLERNQPDFFQQHQAVLEELIPAIHQWFDCFATKPLSVIYGYVDARSMKHREQRHHIQGIIACTYVFTRLYGQQFHDLIRQIAEDHVRADWQEIPEMDDYNVWFWKEKRGY